MEFPFYSKNKILEVLKNNNANIRKSLGQNFLIDPNYINKITSYIQNKILEKHLLEIGPGLGALTHFLINTYFLEVVEIDRVLCKILEMQYNNKIKIYNMDILEFIKIGHLKNYSGIIGNLPYYITTDILINVLKNMKKPGICIFLVQKEYGEKLLENNNSISIYIHNFGECNKILNVPPNAFFPVPKVESVLIEFNIYDTPICKFRKIIKNEFSFKKKKNNQLMAKRRTIN